MSDITFYVNRARQAYSRIEGLKQALAKNPADPALRLSLASAQKLAERAEADALGAARDQQIDVVRYRLVERKAPTFRVLDVSRSLGAFQDLLSHTFYALKIGPRFRATLTPDIRDLTSLQFGWTFPGSLGVVLLAPSEYTLFEGRFDDTITKVRNLVNAKDNEAVKEAGRDLGPVVVHKAFDWASANAAGGFDLDLQWRTSQDRLVGGLIEQTTFERFMGAAQTAQDEEKKVIETRGALVGFNSQSRTFHFVVPDGESYCGQLAEDFPAKQEWSVNHTYDAQITMQKTLIYATNEEKVSYRLKHLN